MKKFLMIALLVGAIPAVAFSQTVTCDACSHDVSVYMGSGGFIAEADGEEVVWVSECDGVTVSGELELDDDGVVKMLFSEDNGLACDDEDGRLQLGPVMDGGWYWITDEMNSAVGSLIDSEVYESLMGTETMPTDAGESVTMMSGKGAVYLKETATGRVGILSTLLPEMPAEDVQVNVCDYTGTPAVRETKSCMLGDGGTVLNAQGPVDHFTGNRAPIPNGGMVTRPVAAGSTVTVTFDLWGNGTGHYTTAPPPADAMLGHEGGTPLDATITGAYNTGAVGVTPPSIDGTGGTSDTAAGLALNNDANNDDIAHLTISPNDTFCDPMATPPANNSVDVTISANADDTDEVTPEIEENTAGTVAATFTLTVVCPSASQQQQGVELVPENPFPTDK